MVTSLTDFPILAKGPIYLPTLVTFSYCLSLGFIAVKRHHDHGNSYKGKHLIGAGLQVRGSVHYYHGRKHGSMQTDRALEK